MHDKSIELLNKAVADELSAVHAAFAAGETAKVLLRWSDDT